MVFRRLTLGIVILLVLVGAVMGYLRWKTRFPDLAILKDQKPLMASVQPLGPEQSAVVVCEYSLHMSYDDAVKSVAPQVPDGWQRETRFAAATFRAPAPSGDFISIERSRTVMGLKPPSVSIGSTVSGTVPQLASTIGAPVPDYKGWITVRTYQDPTTVSPDIVAVMKNAKEQNYAVITPEPVEGHTSQIVDPDSGTSNMESDICDIRFLTTGS